MSLAFSRNFKALRDDRGLTQEQVADALEVTRQTVVRWESSEGPDPRQQEIRNAIKDFFGVSENDLFGFSDGYYAKRYGLKNNNYNAFSRNIKTLREINGITQQQLADALGILQNTVSGWETRGKQPRQKEVIDNICDLYNVTERDLFGFSDGLYAKQYGLTSSAQPIPIDSYAYVVGNIAAGDPSEAIEMSDEKLWVPPEFIERDPKCFYLRVSGDSMDLTDYKDGTYALISPSSEVRTGDIAAVKVNGDEATIKRCKFFDGAIILEPESSNPEYHRRIIDGSDPDAPYVRVLGKAVWSYKKPEW